MSGLINRSMSMATSRGYIGSANENAVTQIERDMTKQGMHRRILIKNGVLRVSNISGMLLYIELN